MLEFKFGSTTSDIILNGYDSIIDYLDTNSPRKAIINLSLGGPNSNEKNERLDMIRQKGGISFAAAGNSNSLASSRSPASSVNTITVGSHDKYSQRSIWPEYGPGAESNYGDAVDIWGPGTDILSAFVGGGYGEKDGTSMATPLVMSSANILANNPHFV